MWLWLPIWFQFGRIWWGFRQGFGLIWVDLWAQKMLSHFDIIFNQLIKLNFSAKLMSFAHIQIGIFGVFCAQIWLQNNCVVQAMQRGSSFNSHSFPNGLRKATLKITIIWIQLVYFSAFATTKHCWVRPSSTFKSGSTTSTI